jgi:Holliday junction resolvase RusA-like endonuclease
MIKITLDTKPVGKMRHRSNGRRTYDPQEAEKNSVKAEMAMQMRKSGWRMIDLPCVCHIRFITERPVSQVKADGTPRVGAPAFHSSKPDIDNAEKFYFDCMNEVVFADDKLVVDVKKTKRWARPGEKSRFEITVTEATFVYGKSDANELPTNDLRSAFIEGVKWAICNKNASIFCAAATEAEERYPDGFPSELIAGEVQ